MKYPKKLIDQVTRASQGFTMEGFLPGQGNENAKLMLLGEAPGKTEIENGIPFSGQAGVWFDSWLKLAGLKREDLYISSTVRSRPYTIRKKVSEKTGKITESFPNRTPNKKEILAHAPLVDYEIIKIKPKFIAPMGNIALKRLLGDKWKVSDCHGQVIKSRILKLNESFSSYEWTEEEYTIFPLYHPASVIYKRSLNEIIEQDWINLSNLLKT
ncbi:uracil-DNA glycosylase [Streptococcaceae bacterium ESL0687]|nr:uracil-DNA glycosylase [Streptococcaceae bacterium ESL0687]